MVGYFSQIWLKNAIPVNTNQVENVFKMGGGGGGLEINSLSNGFYDYCSGDIT